MQAGTVRDYCRKGLAPLLAERQIEKPKIDSCGVHLSEVIQGTFGCWIASTNSFGSCWAPVGKTPIVKTSISHHSRINVIGALLVCPRRRSIRLATRTCRGNMRGDQVEFPSLHLYLTQLKASEHKSTNASWAVRPKHQ